MRILVLGGTTEASALVAGLANRPGFEVILSLAGRTSEPRPAPVPTRIGGFGGAAGLAAWLGAHRTSLLVDATHPFAARISANAARAADLAGVLLLAVRRPPWIQGPGDRWIEVDTVPEAGVALGEAPFDAPRHCLVTIGRNELPAFLAEAPARHRYLVRAIEPIREQVPAGLDVAELLERGPFTAPAEEALMVREGIEGVVTKNAGGAATEGKIEAARRLNLPVVVVRRPVKPDVPRVGSAEEALAWIAAHHPSSTNRGV